MKIKLSLQKTLLGLVLSTCSFVAVAEPDMPIGTWASDNNSTLMVMSNGCTYSAPRAGVNVTGTCEWQPTSATGGILVIRYTTYTKTRTFENSLRFDLQWADDKTILLDTVRYHRQ